ncbi:hypothetical protein QBZ16_002168 [Prototheca wickerhamii]|uniref:Uncharacterized protein n=1 Tax=Prototheca wickerhamii TaxID=3111 RepID=A0AAD9MMJ3_PROWI|nr:hypothetical protein QBZ16_002168 [Prototheca wickerhamii]
MDEGLVLASGSFWEALPPGAVCLSAHYFQEFAREEAAAAAARELEGGERERAGESLARRLAGQARHWRRPRDQPAPAGLAVLTLAVEWQAAGTTTGAACARAAAARRAREDAPAQRRARRRWALLRSHTNAMRAWRRTLLGSWHGLASQLYIQRRVLAKGLGDGARGGVGTRERVEGPST